MGYCCQATVAFGFKMSKEAMDNCLQQQIEETGDISRDYFDEMTEGEIDYDIIGDGTRDGDTFWFVKDSILAHNGRDFAELDWSKMCSPESPQAKLWIAELEKFCRKYKISLYSVDFGWYVSACNA